STCTTDGPPPAIAAKVLMSGETTTTSRSGAPRSSSAGAAPRAVGPVWRNAVVLDTPADGGEPRSAPAAGAVTTPASTSPPTTHQNAGRFIAIPPIAIVTRST